MKLNGKKIFLIVCIICIILVGWYIFRIFSSDLLTQWYSTGGIIGDGTNTYYVINTKNGSKTYVPEFLLGYIGYDTDIQYSQPKIPYFGDTAYTAGHFDNNTIIFTVLRQEENGGSDMYKTNGEKYEFLMHSDKLRSCVAGRKKIFYIECGDNQESSRAEELTDILYRYDIVTGKKEKIKEYNTRALEIYLVKVLK